MTQVKTLAFSDLGSYIQANRYSVLPSAFGEAEWSLSNEREEALLARLKAAGVPLGQYVKGEIYYGIKTGLNEAFVIDAATRDELIRKDPKSAEIIKPFLAGRDVKRYEIPESDRWLILFPNKWTHQQTQRLGTEIEAWQWIKINYPAIATHLETFTSAAQKRGDKGEFWWELRPCDYYPKFEQPKIVYPNICKNPEFTFDNSNLFANQKCFIISLDDKYLLALLNSSITFFLFKKLVPQLRGGFFEPGFKYL